MVSSQFVRLSFLPISLLGRNRPNGTQKENNVNSKLVLFVTLALFAIGTISCNKDNGPVREAVSHKDTYQEA
jgi:hypothetical protein